MTETQNSYEQDGLKVLLTPEAYQKLKDEERKKLHGLTDEEKADVEKQMSDPILQSDSRIGHILQDLWNHPEKCQWYRDHVLFPTVDEKYFPDKMDDNPHEWCVEIPIISMDF